MGESKDCSMKKHNIVCSLLSLACTSMLTASNAYADLVDYGSLQSLFGEPVTTSATGTPQRASDVAANMTIITADEIRQSGSRNIPEIIGRYVSGIDIFQSGVNAFDVGVRGYQQPFQPRLLVLVDGREIFVDDYSRTIWGNIPVNIDDIRQIEVVKGAASALFGSNAAGGVVNIITYSPVYDHNNVASASFGTQTTATGDTTISHKIGEASGVKISAGGLHAHEFNTEYNATNKAAILDPMHQYVTQSSVFQLTPSLQADTEFTYSESRENPQQPTLTNRSAESAHTFSLRGDVHWQTDYGMICNKNYYYHAGSESRINGTLYPSNTNVFISQLQDQFKVGSKHTFRAELEYRNKFYSFNFQQAFPQRPEFQQNALAASGTWLWQMNEKLSWTNALRMDHQSTKQTGTLFANALYTNSDYSHDINALSANSGLVYEATPQDTFRATYGRGIQMPSFIEGGDNVTVQTGANTYFDIEGNPNLRPTVVENYQLAYDRDLPSLYSDFKTAVFYEINHSLIAFAVDTSHVRVVGPNTFTLDQSINVGQSHGFGGEVEFKGKHAGYRWSGSYSYARLHDSVLAAQKLGYDGSTPTHHFRLLGGYTTGAWEFDAAGQAVTSLHMQSAIGTKTQTDGYFALSSRIGYNITEQFTLALSGANITQAETRQSPFPTIERQVFLTLTGRF